MDMEVLIVADSVQEELRSDLTNVIRSGRAQLFLSAWVALMVGSSLNESC